jgi:segregation and condensation protein B
MRDLLRARVEALLFASDRPLSVGAILRVLGDEEGVEKRDVEHALHELIEEHGRREGGFHLVEVAGGYEFRTREYFADDVLSLFNKQPARLSKAALETLAVVTFRQPCTRALVDALRGVDSSGALRTLLERELIAHAGRARVPGRPHLYKTTPVFLRVFGLKSLADLPNLPEIGEITSEHVLRLEDYQRQGEIEGVDADDDVDSLAPERAGDDAWDGLGDEEEQV